MRWPSCSLTVRLWIGVGGIVVFLVASLMCYQYATTTTANAFRQLLRTEVRIDRDVSHAESSLLRCRRAEKDFLFHRDMKDVATFKQELARLNTQCQAVHNQAKDAGLLMLAEQAASAAGRANQYAQAFEQVVAASRRRGLDYDTGLQGRFRDVIRRVDGEMAEHDIDTVNDSLFRLCRSAKEYLGNPTVANGQSWQMAAEALREDISASSCGTETRQLLTDRLARYQKLQQEYLDMQRKAVDGAVSTETSKDKTPDGPEDESKNVESGTVATDELDKQLDSLIADMEYEVVRMNIPQVGKMVLAIRQCEKDYLARGDDSYAAQTHEAVAKLLRAFEQSKIDPKYLQRARMDLRQYSMAFDALVAEDQVIKVSTLKMNQIVGELEPNIRKLAVAAQTLTIEKTNVAKTRAEFLTRVAMFAGAISALVAFVLAFVLPPTIVKPIQKCTTFAQTIAQGDLSGRLEIDREDEVGRLANSLNQMAKGLGQMMQDIKDASEREKVAEAEKVEQKNRQAEAEQHRQAEAAKREQEQLKEEREREQRLADEERRRAAFEQERARVLRQKVDHLLEVVAAAAEGDLTREIRVEGNEPVDELAAGIQRMLRELSAIILEVTQSAEQFTEGSYMIAQSTQELAVGAQSQSTGLTQMSSSIEELMRSIESVRENSTTADEMARETTYLAEEGGQAVQKSSEAMELMRQSAKQIGEIIQVISEIANQTNLLALNAAIEAARAGQHGFGFAVVADEVRKLAERSNQAADEIAKLIRQSTQRVEEGAGLSDQTGKSLRRIINGVETTAHRISRIARVTVEQATIADEVSKVVTQIGDITEKVAVGSEEMAASSEQLGANADRLRTIVSRFKV
ncbi:MAG: methyl-accepting chemotaxis protein [Pirellulales bacterium]|nr:methyl-accepting chemotaxis protein [Pirellulales bacterium]